MSEAALPIRHSWVLSPRDASALQRELASRVIRTGEPSPLLLVAGVDVGIIAGRARAAVAVLSFPSLALVDHAVAEAPVTFPYVPGLLSFREIPVVLAALGRVQAQPDVLLCDGQGIAHPRRCGFASHLGLWTDLPTIGVAKSRLIGTHGPVPDEKGRWAYLLHDDEIIGAALRSRPGVAPIYVSVGHRIGLESAIRCVLACTTRYRLPETTRWAHRLASVMTRQDGGPKTPRRP
ncbi:MAG: deoxyribonuclease V [Burkholderiales bacterium]|nr:deoxyribonuclease V [Burkholderiales bacterium]